MQSLRKTAREIGRGQAFGSVMSFGRPPILVTAIHFRPKPGQWSVGIWTQYQPPSESYRDTVGREGLQGGEETGQHS